MTGDHQHARREDHWDDLLDDEADVHDDLDVFGFAHEEADEADVGAPSQPVGAAGPRRPRTFLRRRGTGYADSTIRTMIGAHLCAEATGEGVAGYADFTRAGRGQYRFAETPGRDVGGRS